MTRSRLLRSILAIVVVAGFVVASFSGPGTAEAAGTRLPAWKGGIDLYRAGTFTTQRSWLWCTAADVQIIRNIVRRARDHSTRSQRTYFDWMRKRDRYALPLSAGVDAAGWTAGLRHFVDDRYRLVASRTFDAALRSAVKRLRQTNLPVAITVSHGNHAWILTGFRATADPARTASFKVTSVRVVGPLYGLQSKNGYDMRPDTRLTPAQLKRFFTPWRYRPKRMIWDGRYISIQPIPARTVARTPSTTTRPAGAASATVPDPRPTLRVAPNPSSPLTPTTPPTATPTASPRSVELAALAASAGRPGAPPADEVSAVPSIPDRSGPTLIVAVGLGVSLVLVLTLGYRVRRRTRPG